MSTGVSVRDCMVLVRGRFAMKRKNCEDSRDGVLIYSENDSGGPSGIETGMMMRGIGEPGLSTIPISYWLLLTAQ